jgi:hypothetical protein
MWDEQLLNSIDELAGYYYNPNWDLNIDQYKAWIATIAWSEGGYGGYTAGSQCRYHDYPGCGDAKDMSYHWDAGIQFRFSTGLGPFQLDRGGYDNWDLWPTIDKLNSLVIG